eukprot:scaffold5207_cov129-Isochrysis_galbana.AAC.1
MPKLEARGIATAAGLYDALARLLGGHTRVGVQPRGRYGSRIKRDTAANKKASGHGLRKRTRRGRHCACTAEHGWQQPN